jgi:hypothetical protein
MGKSAMLNKVKSAMLTRGEAKFKDFFLPNYFVKTLLYASIVNIIYTA